MTGLWLLCCATLLAGCSSSAPAIQYRPVERPPIEGGWLVCAEAPAPAVPIEQMTQRDMAAWLIQWAAAWADCHGKLGAVAEALLPVKLPPDSPP